MEVERNLYFSLDYYRCSSNATEQHNYIANGTRIHAMANSHAIETKCKCIECHYTQNDINRVAHLTLHTPEASCTRTEANVEIMTHITQKPEHFTR